MRKTIIHLVLSIMLLSMTAVHAGQFGGPYFGAKLGVNKSSAADSTGAEIAPAQKTYAYLIQGGYLQGGYNLDLNYIVIGLGAYGDWNSYEKHTGGLSYATRSYGFDAKFGVPVGDWLPYAKFGRGNNKATDDLLGSYQSGPNTAFGFEYKLAPNWSAIVEYKTNKFSSVDNSITIKNNTATFGLNFYFDEPPEPELAPEPVAATEPEQVPILVPIPEPLAPVPEVWKTFMEEKPVRIEGTNFIVGSAEMVLDSGKQPLAEVVEFIASHPDSNLEVIGYTDSRGNERKNLKLSLERANSVKKYLVDTGVAANRITVKGLGSVDPVADNKTEEGRVLNRRVEIRSVIRVEKKVPVKKK